MMAAITAAPIMIHIVIRRVVMEAISTTFESRNTRTRVKSCGRHDIGDDGEAPVRTSADHRRE
jgi:hypothetical protein